MWEAGQSGKPNAKPPVNTAGLAFGCPHEIPENPLVAEKVIQEEIKNGFTSLVSWTVSLIAKLDIG